MKNSPQTDKVKIIFDDTISWYEKQNGIVHSKILRIALSQDIIELKNAKKLAVSSLLETLNKLEERSISKNKWNGNLLAQQKALAEIEAKFPKNARKEIIEQYQNIIDIQKKMIEGTKSNIKALEDLWKTQDDISFNTTQETVDLIELFISLKINKVTFNRIIESSRAIVTSIPGISNVISIANGSYDLARIWLTPIKDTGNTDKFLLWLERRQDMIKYLQLRLLAFKPFF